MFNPVYLDAISDILKARPDCAFVWTGKAQSPNIQGHFEKAGVADRCLFIGWINTKLWAQVIDMYIDSFPFGSGHTIMQSMAAEKPVLMYRSQESLETGIPTSVLPALEGRLTDQDATLNEVQADIQDIFQSGNESLFLCPDNVEDYVSAALRLIDDESYARKVAAAGKRFVYSHISDSKKMVLAFNAHLQAVICEN